MNEFAWIKDFNAAITVCDKEGIVIYMNEKACRTFDKQGEKSMIGQSLFPCHKPESAEKIRYMLENNTTNNYTIEKNGIKKHIYQSPWYKDEQVAGMVEISMEIPFEMPNYKR